jgi:flavin reductase (DIM6/NTAB) family NADH-FMN oxidoreductase RutF
VGIFLESNLMEDQPIMLDTYHYRQVMGRFATGVTVLLTKTDDGEAIGMTANALTSVSLEPMLLLVCVAKNAHVAPHILSGDSFTLSILNEEQGAVSDYFAGIYGKDTPPDYTIEPWESGLRLADCLGSILCNRGNIYDEGDHWIVMGQVIALDVPENPPAPLVFFAGKYRRLAPGVQDHL